MLVKLSVDETIRSIELGRQAAVEIFNKNKNYCSFYLNYLIEKNKSALMKFNFNYIQNLINYYSKIFKVISYEDKLKLVMESIIEDINKYRYLIKLYEIKIVKKQVQL